MRGFYLLGEVGTFEAQFLLLLLLFPTGNVLRSSFSRRLLCGRDAGFGCGIVRYTLPCADGGSISHTSAAYFPAISEDLSHGFLQTGVFCGSLAGSGAAGINRGAAGFRRR